MSDVLKEVIAAGHGIGWLPESAVDPAAAALIAPVGGPDWVLPLDICAFRPRRALGPQVDRLWRALADAADRPSA